MKQPAQNLYHLLRIAASAGDTGITVYPPGAVTKPGEGTRLSYAELFERAKANARLIHQIEGISRDSTVLLHFDQHLESIEWFWAVIVAGYLPVVSTPFVNDLDQRTKHLVHLNNLLKTPVILTNKRLAPEFLGLEQLKLNTIENLTLRDGCSAYPLPDGAAKEPEDLAVLMLTSGSTGNAKAVCLRHGQVLRAVEGKSIYHDMSAGDVFLNWIGMDHVANLTESHLQAMNLGAEQVHAQAADMLMEPLAFLRLIHKHRAAYTFAPNFFLASLRRALDDAKTAAPEKTQEFELSCLKALISGGEANVVETCAALSKYLYQFHIKRDVIRPGFGMTETCAGSIYGTNCPSYDVARNLEFASLGSCIPGIEMRVVDPDGRETSTDEVGDLQVTGPIVFGEYYNNPTATADAFTHDGWFITGDRATIDSEGNLNLAGRSKESIIINGVKYFPHELEIALESAEIPGLTPSYTVVFPHRPKGSETEVLCVVYLPTFAAQDVVARVETVDAISKVSGLICGVRPYETIPLNRSLLTKSSLGKLSRTKIRTAFETGVYQNIQDVNNEIISEYRRSRREQPSSDLEKRVLAVFGDMFKLPADEIGVDSSLFDLGVSSIDLISFKQHLEKKLSLEVEIPLIMVLTNPTIRAMAHALESLNAPKEYSPVVTLQTRGDKTPLWLVHPGVGEVLVFLNLAKYITDRPIYALRARGFDDGEEFFKDIPDVVDTYHAHMKRVQPTGPYAIAGYSFGAMLAFEVSKKLESNGDEVRFLGSFNLPPHIKYRMQQLDWVEVVLNLAYFLDLMSEEYAHAISPVVHNWSDDAVLEHIMKLAPTSRLEELSLTKKKLGTWASLAEALQAAARNYDPSGSVACIDIFFAIPLSAVAKNKQDWVDNYLSKWKDFSRTEPRFTEVDGAHYTMMGPEHILSFQKKLRTVLTERGL
ncbi:MAG: putative NRPS-like protein biosynthetic cluster [Thelocarpon impressellum]|nr:MAG: putative NRPS-like protein biosynthetic cluster [Thelocarpon impressellum]